VVAINNNFITNTKLIQFRVIKSECNGSLTPIYSKFHIPFEINRLYYIYNIPDGSKRGGHAHKDLQQLLVAISGSFDVILKDGHNEKSITLNDPCEGLLIPSMIWRELINFTNSAICLALASLPFDENDYIRDYDKYLNIVSKKL